MEVNEQPDGFEWELSKENVQPLRQGRQMSSLTAALRSRSLDTSVSSETDPKQNIRAQQNAFEQELREYSDTDPFDVWDRYIKWTEQHFPRGRHDGQLMTLMERCLREFQSISLYKDDPRFIKVWIKFASSCPDTAEVYSYMFDNQIGVTVALLYAEWATCLEIRGDSKRADAIFTEGLNRCAQPKTFLQQKKLQFEQRVARNITLQVAESEYSGQDQTTDALQRTALGRLKVSKKKVCTSRTGQAIVGSAGILKVSRRKVSSQVSVSDGLTIFTDTENVPSSLQPTQSNEWQSLPTRAVDNRENDKKPGKWTEARAKQMPGTVPRRPSSPSFQIHEDPDAPKETRKTTFVNSQPLSSIKAPAPQNVLHKLQKSNEPLTEIPMYAKNKVYNGLHEFSLEELRAIRWRKKKEVLRKEVEEREHRETVQRQMQQTNQKLEVLTSFLQPLLQRLSVNTPAEQGLMQLLQQQQEKQQEQLQEPQQEQHQQQLPRQAQQLPQLQEPVILHPEISGSAIDTMDSAVLGVNAEGVMETMNSVVSGVKVRSTMKTIGGAVSLVKARSRSLTPNSEELLSQSLASSQGSHSKVQQTPKSGETTLDSSTSFSFKQPHPLTAPSPTVMTREAMQVVHRWFSAPFEQDSTLAVTQEITHPHAPQLKKQGIAFKICEDIIENIPKTEDEEKHVVSVCRTVEMSTPDRKGLQIYCDTEIPLHNEHVSVCRTVEMSTPDRKGLQIYCDTEIPLHNEQVKPVSQKKNVRRGLGFSSSGDSTDDKMSDDDQFNVCNDFTMVVQARDDVTLAPLDSFFIHAATASTPFNVNKTAKHTVDAEDDSDTEMRTPVADGTDSTDLEGDCDVQTSFRKLSPILEGSGDDTKSSIQQSSQVSDANVTLMSRQASRRSTTSQNEPILEADQTDEDVCDSSMLSVDPLDYTYHHDIYTNAYVPELPASLHQGPAPGKYDPFDEVTIVSLLQGLEPPLTTYPKYMQINSMGPQLYAGVFTKIGDATVLLGGCIGEGGYAKIYESFEQSDYKESDESSGQHVVKVQSPPCYWEFYTCHQLRHRLSKLATDNAMLSSIMEIERGVFYLDKSILNMPYMLQGTLLSLVNIYKPERSLLTGVEPFACLLTIQLLALFEQIHQCGFIHGDVKPDNFMVNSLSPLSQISQAEQLLSPHHALVKLIDFGQACDLSLFPSGTTFTAKVKTSGFECIEMRLGKPWTFQPDLFGLAGTLHVILFGAYMKVYQEDGQWKVTGNYIRKWNVLLWKKLFHQLLNIPSCDEMPNLRELRHKFQDYFMSTGLDVDYNAWLTKILTKIMQLKCQTYGYPKKATPPENVCHPDNF